MYVDGIYLKRNWDGEYENVAVLVAIAVNEDGYREVLGAAEGIAASPQSVKGKTSGVPPPLTLCALPAK